MATRIIANGMKLVIPRANWGDFMRAVDTASEVDLRDATIVVVDKPIAAGQVEEVIEALEAR